MPDDRTFTVTLLKPGHGLPYIEVGAYEYVAEWLPSPGDTITVSRIAAGDGAVPVEVRGFVTRVDPAAETPISVTEVDGNRNSTDDILA